MVYIGIFLPGTYEFFLAYFLLSPFNKFGAGIFHISVKLSYGEQLAQASGAGFARSVHIDDEVPAVDAFIIFFLVAFRFRSITMSGAGIILRYGSFDPAENIIVDGDCHAVNTVAACPLLLQDNVPLGKNTKSGLSNYTINYKYVE
jgi:hypothetical protein